MPIPSLSTAHQRHLLHGILAIHRRMADLEALITQAARPSPFSTYVNDLSPTEARVLQDYFARIRAAMLAHLQEIGIPLEVRQTSLRWAVQVHLSHLQVTVDDLGPAAFSGYGPLDTAGQAMILQVQEDLARWLDRVQGYLQQGLGRDLSRRLARLEAAPASVASLTVLDRIISRWKLIEFRPMLDLIVSRLEDLSYEIAVFGRVSSGKSSLLNHLAGSDALPVGVTPITAVPTRLARGDAPSAIISLAEQGQRVIKVEQLWEYASEEGNPGNRKHVTGILVRWPAPRLRDGVVFIDTPGIGSLAREGADEALAYLPRCDLGIVLIDAASAPNSEDVALLRALYEAGIPAMVLLSKADLLAAGDRQRMADYIREQLGRELGLDLPVHPVSVVGADASLLISWFEREITPLLERHRSLAEASLRRKIAHLREAVAAALARLRGRCGGVPGGHLKIDAPAVRHFLDEGDAAIRHARNRCQEWSVDRQALWEMIPDRAAPLVMRAPPSPSVAHDDPLVLVLRDALTRRGRSARELVCGLQRALGRTLEGLQQVAPRAQADPEAIRGMRISGLPLPDLGPLPTPARWSRPWWAPLLPRLAIRMIRNDLRERLGSAIRDVVEFYDRQLQAWAKAEIDRLVGNYESQADLFRELVRHLPADFTEAGATGDLDDWESDLRELQRTEDVEPEPKTTRAGGGPARAGHQAP
ncbi:MAG: dynamin family protein [Isosphaeraceae bacterium]|nr:dynamin family protein [Isosphaeraceae bacterium]